MNDARFVPIKKVDGDRQIIYAEVYAPYVLDTHGEYMRPEGIETLAHRYMKLNLRNSIDTEHNNIPNGSYPVESFIANAGGEYTPGAWVLGIKVEDPHTWELVKSGALNALSFEALVKKLNTVVEVEVSPSEVGETEEADGHTHLFFAEISEEGVVTGGMTSVDRGHSHKIAKGSATEKAEGHAHRFFI